MSVRKFDSPETLARDMAEEIAGHLRTGIADRGRAVLAVSGGSTPKRLFAALSEQDLAWGQVTIVPVDERWVPHDDERSNARLVFENLMIGRAASASFVSLYDGSDTPKAGASAVGDRIAALPRPFDVLMLGMGTDGHTASFFPGGDNLEAATSRKAVASVSPMNAEGAGEPRITLTLPVILDARNLYLHIEGSEKMHVLERALTDGPVDEYPIRAVLKHAPDLDIVWTR